MELLSVLWTLFCMISGCYCAARLGYKGIQKIIDKVIGPRKTKLTIKSEITGQEETLDISPEDNQNLEDIAYCNKFVQDASKLNTKLLEASGLVDEIGEIKDSEQLISELEKLNNLRIIGPAMSEVVLQLFTCKHNESQYLQFVPGKRRAK